MAEFGENLKKVREEKGITQQTLADYLYVTRQAVSRWEGGSRYPDIMTAKKISQYLEVSLDELLSDDDMKLYVEKNAILDSSISKRTQMVLLSLAFMCSLVLSIIYLCNYLIQDIFVLSSSGEMIKSILLTVILGYGIYVALCDKLNPKIAALIAAFYLGTAIVTGIAGLFWNETGFTFAYLIGATILNIVFLSACILFFGSKKHMSPVPIYVIAGIYGLVGTIMGVISFVTGTMGEIPIEIRRDVMMINIFSFIQSVLLLALLVIMAYALNRKRKLAEK